jgi:predicted HD superfamily hydrolase involved in NAD metabolism
MELARRVRAEIGQEHRYAHCVRVARCAELLARRYGADPKKARLAGLLHDLARLYSPQRLLAECETRRIPINDLERAEPMLLHARLGAELARERFGVEDPAVLSAIAKHTCGDGEMSPLDCVVYLADGLEPGRNFPEREALWGLAQRDLTAAMRGTLSSMIGYLQQSGLTVAPQTVAAARHFGVVCVRGDIEAG